VFLGVDRSNYFHAWRGVLGKENIWNWSFFQDCTPSIISSST